MSQAIGKSKHFNNSIHGLRGIAALCVFLFHIYDMSRKLELIPEDINLPLKGMLISLAAGVDIFFMISGYLITLSLIRHANVKNFLIDRAVRIYPVFLFLHLCLFAVAPLLHYKWLADISPFMWIMHFFSNLFFLPGVFDLPLMQLSAWSLSYELAFYLFSSVIYFFWSRKRIVSLLLLAIIMPVLIAIYPRAIFFAVGSLVYFVLRNKAHISEKIPTLGALAVLPFFMIMAYANVIGPYRIMWLSAPLGFFIFLDVVRNANPLAAFLKLPVVQFLGTISYSFYLWHAVVTFPLKHLAEKILIIKLGLSGWVAVAAFGIIAFAITIPVSYISYLVLEQYCGKKLKTWINRNKTR